MAILFQLIGRLIKWTAIAIIYLTPVLGVWLAFSLAAYNNRSTSLAVLAGVFLFPILYQFTIRFFAHDARGLATATLTQLKNLDTARFTGFTYVLSF